MAEKRIKWLYTKKVLSEQELEELANHILVEDLPLDNNLLTDEEDDGDDLDDFPFDNDFVNSVVTEANKCTSNSNSPPQLSSSTYVSGEIAVQAEVEETAVQAEVEEATVLAEVYSENNVSNHTQLPCSSKGTGDAPLESNKENKKGKEGKKVLRSSKIAEVTPDKKEEEGGTEANRRWKKALIDEYMPNYNFPEGPDEAEFIGCSSATDVYLRVVGESIDDIVFQSNLYATQNNKTLNLTKEELLAFIGINFLMAYHRLPSWKQYWNTSQDLGLPIVANCMPRNRFEEILRYLHCNDNSLLPQDNTDKIYKVRPLSDTLNRRFKECYSTTRRVSVDESMILFKGRSSLKQYNPLKPIKRGYKLWCIADQNAYISKFDVYQGKNEQLEQEFKEYGLGERVVLSLTKSDWNKNKIIYADNYFLSIHLLETLLLKNTLACGTIRSSRKGFPPMMEDKTMVRGDYDYRVSNTKIRAFKWRDNKIVHFASNFHSTEEVSVKRTQKDGTRLDVKCPSIVADYNKHMGGVDRADQLRSTYGIIRRSRKWWHRLFWGFLDIAFVNAFIIFNSQFEKISTFEYRRAIALGFIAMNSNRANPRKSGPIVKRRKYNYSVPDDVRLGNLGSHWVLYEKKKRKM